MSSAVVYLPEAEDDIISAYDWYEQELPGLGERFLRFLNDALDRIRDNPQLYGVCYQNVRAVPLKRFPYVIYYRDRDSDVLVVAVQHGGRHTRAWKDRIN